MAPTNRRANLALVPPKILTVEQFLYAHPYEFEFHQVVKILESLSPPSALLGEEGDPLKEALTIQARIALALPAADVYGISPSAAGPVTVKVNFLGLAGIQGPLPVPYTELIIERLRHKDTALRDFLDIFNHRLISVLHRMRRKKVPGIDQTPFLPTPLGETLLDFIGLEHKSLRNCLSVPDASLLSCASLLWQRPRSAVGLVRLLHTHFQVPVDLRECHGHWLKADPLETTKIGLKGQFNQLGKGAILGEYFWDQSFSMEVCLGPLKWEEFCDFLPGGTAHGALHDLTYFYLGQEFSVKFALLIHHQEIPPVHLNGHFSLGLTTWLGRSVAENPKVIMPISFWNTC